MPTVCNEIDTAETPVSYTRGSLNLRTLELLKERPRHMTYEKIVGRCIGSNSQPITSNWLHQFQCGKIKNPDVDRVQALYEMLSGSFLIFN